MVMEDVVGVFVDIDAAEQLVKEIVGIELIVPPGGGMPMGRFAGSFWKRFWRQATMSASVTDGRRISSAPRRGFPHRQKFRKPDRDLIPLAGEVEDEGRFALARSLSNVSIGRSELRSPRRQVKAGV